MATVWIPPLMRSLTDNEQKVEVPGETLRDVIDNLDDRFPGIKDRLMEEGRVRPSIAVAIDGEVNNEGVSLSASVAGDSEIHFVPAISGGR